MTFDAFPELHAEPPRSVRIGDTVVTRGSRVRLNPSARGDIVDLALAGRVATVETIEMGVDGTIHIAVTVDDDPGRDLGTARFPGHRFFFTPDELLPLDVAGAAPCPRILIAGVGNIFHGDDAFGVAVARRMAGLRLPAGVTVVDFGIRSLDLAFALQDEFALVILVDAMPRDGLPGQLYLIEPILDDVAPAPDAHDLNPAAVLHLARSLGRLPERVVVLGCEPQSVEPSDSPPDGLLSLSPAVQAAVDTAVDLLSELVTNTRLQTSPGVTL